MAELRDLGRRLVEDPPVPPTPSAELRRRWRRRQLRRGGAAVAVIAAAAVAVVGTLAAQGSGTTRIQVIAPPPSGSPPPSTTGTTSSSLAGSPVAFSWTSEGDGWKLTTHPCAQGLCPGLDHTSDGGGHWIALPDPPAVFADHSLDCSAATIVCVNAIAFATPTIGYLYGPALLVTTDGGLTWHRQSGPFIQTMAIDGPQALRVVYTSGGCPGPCQFILQRAPIGTNSWHTLLDKTDLQGITTQILSPAHDIVMAIYGNLAQGAEPAAIYRSLDRGETWDKIPDPCTASDPTYALTQLAATATGGALYGLCGTPASKPTTLINSTDNGSTWISSKPIPGPDHLNLLAAASPTTVAVASTAAGGSGPFTAELLVSTDNGFHWTTAATDHYDIQPNVLQPGWLGFPTPQTGLWLAGPNRLWDTRNGGHTWSKNPLP